MSLKRYLTFWKKEPPRHKTAADNKPKHQEKDLEYVFTDLDGKNYFTVNHNIMGNSIQRVGKAEEFNMYMSAGMTGTNIKKFIGVAINEMENLVRGIPGSLPKATVALNEVLLACDIVIHTELLYNYVAVHYIREDEDFYEYSERIQIEKVEAFKRMDEAKKGFFLTLPEYRNSIGLLKLSPEELEQSQADSMREIKRQERVLKALESMVVSEKPKRTGTPNSWPSPKV